MRNLLRCCVITAAVAAPAAEAADYRLDPEHTFVYFSVSHAAMATAYGRFNGVEGTLSMDRDAGTGALNVVLDAASVDTNHKRRDDHLRSPDFLNAVEFPEIVYRSTKVTFDDGDGARVDGELTLLGQSRPLSLRVTDITCGVHMFTKKDSCGFHATGTVKRSDYGMSYALPDGVGDELNLMLSTEAVKQ